MHYLFHLVDVGRVLLVRSIVTDQQYILGLVSDGSLLKRNCHVSSRKMCIVRIPGIKSRVIW